MWVSNPTDPIAEWSIGSSKAHTLQVERSIPVVVGLVMLMKFNHSKYVNLSIGDVS